MRADLVSKGRSLTGSSDLTLFAALKPGLVPSLDAVSYKTRTQRLLRLLQGGRVSLHEYAIHRPLSDAVERVARIHSFRVTVLEPEDTVMLAVTFDGTWESYIRVLWQKVGSLLDIIFCNTEGYVLSTEGFGAWCGWVQRVQVETAFFFNTHALTVDDVHWLRGAEAIQRAAACPHQAALDVVRHRARTPEEIAYECGQTTTLPALDNVRQGLQSLALLFRLTDLYLPGTPDGEVLQRAARDLLMEFRPLVQDPDLTPEFLFQIRQRFQRQLDWLFDVPYGGRPPATPPRPLPGPPEHGVPDRPADVQGGMLRGYEHVTHGCLVLLAFDDAAAGARLLARLLPRLATEAGDPAGAGPFFNIGLSHEGLRRLGTSESLLAALPQEFREGMEARASMLGDFRVNHPRRWRLPRRNWRFDRSGLHDEGPPMPIQAVHAVLQVRCRVESGEPSAAHALPQPLHQAVMAIVLDDASQPLRGVQVLSVQPMHRLQGADGVPREHFGFADGKSQPVFPRRDAAPSATAGPARYDNRVHLGELLLGYDNEADFAPVPTTPEDAARWALLHNGSFMVVRKLRQDVAAWRRVTAEAAAQTKVPLDTLRAKLMGRWADGSSLVGNPDAPGGTADNDFDFADDADGRACPVHSHVRRSNPRLGQPGIGEPPGRRRPRIVRRGMSYGPVFDGAPDADPPPERGMVFIAFNAHIAEQFEIVQRWVAGGNSTGGFSGHTDPLMGVPEPGQTRVFRFEHAFDEAQEGGTTARVPRSVKVELDASPAPFAEPEPLVRLEWGGYFFCPSVAALTRLQRAAAAPPAAAASRPPPWSAAEGQRRIARLLAIEAQHGADAAVGAWKAAVEDTQATEQLAGASLWAAVRQHDGGVLRTPYGVLVAEHDRVMEVLGDDSRFSVSGYHRRMVASRFDIYLGLDRHPLGAASRYDALSGRINAAIGQLDPSASFDLARQLTLGVLQTFVDGEIALAKKVGASRWELNIDVKEVLDRVLSGLCQRWLGVAHKMAWQDPGQNEEMLDGSWRWNWAPPQAPLCPAHFTPPSRHFFQPRPGAEVRDWGERCAAALADAMTALVRRHRAAGTLPMDGPLPAAPGAPPPRPAVLARAVFEALAVEDDATVGRSLAGVMMGFLPTLDGSFRLVLNEWLRLGSFWQHRAAWGADGTADTLAKARARLERSMREAMQFRPAPELIWRTAVRADDRLGGVALNAGDIVVLALVSASQQKLAAGSDDVYALFGGERRAGGPTHACPGYGAALAVMLGMLAGWVGVPHTLRASPAPLAFSLEGEVP